VSTDLLRTLLASLEAEMPGAIPLRERLHANPEPSNAEHGTARIVAEALDTRYAKPVAGTGLVARIGPVGGRTVAVRAELDALPIREQTGAPFAAKGGFMHACGHDVHMAALAALFRAARRSEDSLAAPLLALYQPSEESYPSGAEVIAREGALAGEVGAFVTAHVHTEVPWGSVSVEPGPVNASCDYLRIIVEGVGGHGAYPHRTRDPILALSHIVVALQSLVSRRLDPTHPGVLSVGWTRAGSAENVIPEVAEAGGTLRALKPEDRRPLREAAREIVEATARAHDCIARMEVTEGEPATINDATIAAAVRALAPEAGFELAPPMRSCGSDDFGFYGRLAPTLMEFVGLDGAPGTGRLSLHPRAFCPHPRRLGPSPARRPWLSWPRLLGTPGKLKTPVLGKRFLT
jgi:amidohydrolase